MKRKVKFQEGGMVETPSQRRVRLADEARTRSLEYFDDLRRRNRAAAAEREASRQNFERERRFAGRQDFTTTPEGVTRRGAATGREVVPFDEGRPPRTTARQALSRVATPAPIPLGSPRPRVGGNIATMAAGVATGLAEPIVNYGRRFMERRGQEIAGANRQRADEVMARERDMQAADMPGNLASNRGDEQAAARMREVDMQGADVPGNRAMSPPPRPRPRPAPRPVERRELTAEELRALMSGEREPRTSEERALREGLRGVPQMSEADRLNERELQRIRAERAAEEAATRQMGGSGDIGAASARARGEQVGPPGDYNNFRKGGMVKAKAKPVAKKAGGMVAAKPKAAAKPAAKKMMKGGIVAKPKSKAKPMTAMKRGGMVKKGKK
jgi:hypothetical protein